MAHSDDSSEAVDVRTSITMDEAASVFDDDIEGAGEELSEEEVSEGGPDFEDEADEAELEDEGESEDEDDEGDEPKTAIEAPASLNAEEKAAFAALTPEGQSAWAASEARRNTQVQEATTKASIAQRDAEARAAAADAEAQRVFAAQLDQFVSAYTPQAPDPQLAYDNPQAYVAQKAQYDAMKAQHDELVQQVKAVGTEADEQETKAFLDQRDRELMQIPEVANPETRQGYLDRAFKVAADLGYDQSQLAQSVSAEEVKHLNQIAEWQEKAGKYDKAMSRKMTRVRAGKPRTMKPGAAQPQGSGNKAGDKAVKAFKANTSSMSAAAAVFND